MTNKFCAISILAAPILFHKPKSSAYFKKHNFKLNLK